MKSGIAHNVKSADGTFSLKDVAEMDNIEFNYLIEQRLSSGDNGWNLARLLATIIAALPEPGAQDPQQVTKVEQPEQPPSQHPTPDPTP